MWPCTIVGWEKLSIKVVPSLKIQELAWVNIKLRLIMGWPAYIKKYWFSWNSHNSYLLFWTTFQQYCILFQIGLIQKPSHLCQFFALEGEQPQSQLSMKHFFPVSFAFHVEWSHFSRHSPPVPLILVPSLQTSPVDFDPVIPNLCVPTLRPHKMPLEWSPCPHSQLPFLPDFIQVPSRGCLFDHSNAYRTLLHHYTVSIWLFTAYP